MLKRILKQTRLLDVRTRNKITSLFAGNYRSAFKGRGIEFADIRPYDTGDDTRDIDWKTSSKQGELYVKTYHESRDNTLFFILDGSAGMQFTSTGKKKLEVLLETFALLAFSAAQNGDRVGAYYYGGGVKKVFPPKKGRRNVMNILAESIALYEREFTAEHFEEAEVFKECVYLLKNSSTVFWLSGRIELSEGLCKKIRMLRMKHDFVPVVFSDPWEEGEMQTGRFTFQDVYSGKLKSLFLTERGIANYTKERERQRRLFLKFFQKNRMETLWLRTTDNLYAKLYAYFRLKQQHAV